METQNFANLYSGHDKAILKTAEDTLNPRVDRVQELIAYAKAAQLTTIGVAYCVAVANEAEHLQQIFEQEGFTVEKVNCKYGRVPFNDLVEGYKGISCNPAGQAQYLADKGTQLNVMMGLCVGHDMIFNAKSKAPVTPLVVKDRKLKHHTASILK